MFLFILESIGTQELIIIGIVALMFLGPRKLPDYARKIGKLMSEFRTTTSEFKETWQREVSFEEETKALRVSDLEGDVNTIPDHDSVSLPDAVPEIKTIDREEFEKRATAFTEKQDTEISADSSKEDKRNWL